MLRAVGTMTLAVAMAATAGSAALSQEAGVVDTPVQSTVDFDRVNSDIAKATETGFRETVVFPGSAEFGDFTPPVPIMVPMKLFVDLDAGASSMRADEVGLKSDNQQSTITFSRDGYFGTVSYTGYNVTIEGTTRQFTKNNDESPAFTGPKPDYFNIFDDGASFGYAGADYLLLIECVVGDADCVSENGISKIIDDFILCSNDNQCVNFFPVKRG
jgi:hypothetical protein